MYLYGAFIHRWAVPCREASKKASLLTESSTLDTTKEPLKLPGFEVAVMQAVTKALENWRDEALEGALHDATYILIVHLAVSHCSK